MADLVRLFSGISKDVLPENLKMNLVVFSRQGPNFFFDVELNGLVFTRRQFEISHYREEYVVNPPHWTFHYDLEKKYSEVLEAFFQRDILPIIEQKI